MNNIFQTNTVIITFDAIIIIVISIVYNLFDLL